MKHIAINGARLHNLKHINVRIPKDKLTVVTGVSGSGKSSLVFDIIFEEGKRQYLQSIGMLPGITQEDKFDQITGVGPTVAVQQAIIRQSNPRSLVGTKTRILAYLGLFYASEGRVACSNCGKTVGGDLVCEGCGNVEERLEANYFSANSPQGMCLQCEGRGVHFELVLEKLVPDPDITLRQMLANAGVLSSFGHLLKGRLKAYVDTPFSDMPEEAREHILYGVQLEHPFPRRSLCLFTRLRYLLSRGKDVGGMMVMTPCPQCQGYRVGEEARRVTIGGKHIGQIGHMTILELQDFLSTSEPLSAIGQNLVKELLQKTHYLIQVGLGHLTPYRPMPTLSGGEIQRIFLTAHLDSNMDSVIYVLDEPTVGLHEIEKADLLEQVAALRTLGNTVIVVEHDKNTIEQAGHVIDFGPLAGSAGGEIVYEGDYAGLLKSEASLTGQYLSGRRAVPRKAPHEYATISAGTAWLTLHHARTHNLKGVTVRFPLGVLVGVAGVSGSGKSSLVSDTLIPLLERHFADLRERKRSDSGTDEEVEFVMPSPVAEKLDGMAHIAGYAQVSQAPIGRRSISNPASYVKIWGKIRKLFAQQALAKQRGYTPGHFSFNAKGACPECKGKGHERFWLGGNSFVTSSCAQCHGKRYRDEILDVTYRGANIVDVLNMSVTEAGTLFGDTPAIHKTLRVLEQTGMGYITLGQPTNTLSGGEAQRIKLAKEIGRRRRGNILYVLDEPTTGAESVRYGQSARTLGYLGETWKLGHRDRARSDGVVLLRLADRVGAWRWGGGGRDHRPGRAAGPKAGPPFADRPLSGDCLTLNRDYWPTQGWRTADPESVGMRGALLSKLEREIKTRFRGIAAFLVVRSGYLAFEGHYGACGQDDKHLVASVTKSFISALIGVAIDQGFIEGVHQNVLDFFPEHASGARDPLKQKLTIKHLLTMTAGFQWRTGARNRELYIDRLRRSKDWVAFILGLPLRERSFGTFQYNSGASHLLSAIITRSTGRCAQDFAAEHLFEPIGMERPAPAMPHTYSQADVFRNKAGGWPRDPQGNSIGGWGLFLKPRDMARFGYLYLNHGRWDGAQIIPKKWVEDSVSPHTPGYGYQWWLRDVNGVFAFSAVGQGGQHIFCIPQRDLVVVVASNVGSRWRERWPLLEEFVIPAVVSKP